MPAGQQAKISVPEVLIVSAFLLLVDIVELAILFVGADDFWITDALAFPATQIYLRWKGVRGTYSLALNVIELIPYVGWLPLKTLGFLLAAWVDRRAGRRTALETTEAAARGSSPAPRARVPAVVGGQGVARFSR